MVIVVSYVVTYTMYTVNVSIPYIIVVYHGFNYYVLFNTFHISLWVKACIRLLQRKGSLHIILISILYFNKL